MLLTSINQSIKCSFINRHDITQANISGRTYIKTGVSKCFCTASVSENYNQTTELYAEGQISSCDDVDLLIKLYYYLQCVKYFNLILIIKHADLCRSSLFHSVNRNCSHYSPIRKKQPGFPQKTFPGTFPRTFPREKMYPLPGGGWGNYPRYQLRVSVHGLLVCVCHTRQLIEVAET